MKQDLFGQLRWVKPEASHAPRTAEKSAVPSRQLPESPTRRAIELYGIPQTPMHDRTPLAETLFLLKVVAEIEHALLVQYLYAVYSINTKLSDPKPAAWATTIKNIAIQEMDHLINVQNMLVALKSDTNATYFDRANFPVKLDKANSGDSSDSVGFYPFPFRLEPLTGDSLSKYVSAESPLPESIEDPTLRTTVETIIQRAEQATGMKMIGHVGTLYAYLYWLFLPTDTTSGPWPNFPADCFRSRAGWHVSLKDFADAADIDRFQADFMEFRGTDGSLYNPTKPPLANPHRYIFRVKSAEDALLAITQIAIQGEGLEFDADSHFREFLDVYLALAKFTPPQGTSVQLAIPTNPNLREDPDTAEGRITNKVTRQWALLCNTRYLMLLQELPLALSLPKDQPDQLANRKALIADAITTEMKVGISKLALRLAGLQRASNPAEFAGPPFELPDEPLPCTTAGRWRELVRLIGVASELIGSLRTLSGSDAPTPDDLAIFDALEKSDQALLQIVQTEFRPPSNEHANPMAIPPLNSFADVQALFNDFVAANGTDVAGSPHGVLWNNYDAFVNGSVPGIDPPNIKILVKGDADHSNIITILKGPLTLPNGATIDQMPADGSGFMSQDMIAALADWINRGCPQ